MAEMLSTQYSSVLSEPKEEMEDPEDLFRMETIQNPRFTMSPLIRKTLHVGDPAHYRPVALTSHLIELFEKILKKHIVAYMEENNLFNPGQHGVRLGRSCLSKLIAHYDHITRLLDSGQNVDVICQGV